MKKLLIPTLFNFLLTICGQEIAWKKCIEYSHVLNEIDHFNEISRNFYEEFEESSCTLYDNTLIVGGTLAKPKEFPHMAVIGFGNEDEELKWMCGGTLISKKHVLTAAHCATSALGPPRKVKLGATHITEVDDYVQNIPIREIIIHPNYKRPVKYHDIAIMVLEKVVDFSSYVRPACLGIAKNLTGTTATATGFGTTKYRSLEGSAVLLKVDVDILHSNICRKFLDISRILMPSSIEKGQLCAGKLEGGKDTCQGDSGGPLQIHLDVPFCMSSVIGVTSFGMFCGMANSPAIYTNVQYYVPWIESVVWPQVNDSCIMKTSN